MLSLPSKPPARTAVRPFLSHFASLLRTYSRFSLSQTPAKIPTLFAIINGSAESAGCRLPELPACHHRRCWHRQNGFCVQGGMPMAGLVIGVNS